MHSQGRDTSLSGVSHAGPELSLLLTAGAAPVQRRPVCTTRARRTSLEGTREASHTHILAFSEGCRLQLVLFLLHLCTASAVCMDEHVMSQ